MSRVAPFVAGLAALTLVLKLVPRRLMTIPAATAGRWDLPACMAVATALVVGLTTAATALGPDASGVVASFPLIGALIAAFAHVSQGPAAGVSVMRGMAGALYAFAVFFLIAGFAPTRMPLVAAFGLAAGGPP